MSKIRIIPLDPDKVIRCLKKLGYWEARQKGSHKIFKNVYGKIIVIPYHKGEKLRRGLISKIIKQLGVSVEEFYELIRDP